jgi:8-oxo-dGTP pyrophosphatase MutT (NUDIX family)
MWARVIIVAPNATVGVARKWSAPPRGDFAGDARLVGQRIMKDETKLTTFQRIRTRVHLFLTAMRKRLTVGVRAVLLDGRKVLLVKHTYTPGWQFPGGGVEPGETAETAAAREALEETGYAVDGRPVLHGFFLNRIAGGKRDHVAVYIWRDFRSQLEFAPNLEIAECGWFDVDALPADVGKGTERRIREIFDKSKPASEW